MTDKEVAYKVFGPYYGGGGLDQGLNGISNIIDGVLRRRFGETDTGLEVGLSHSDDIEILLRDYGKMYDKSQGNPEQRGTVACDVLTRHERALMYLLHPAEEIVPPGQHGLLVVTDLGHEMVGMLTLSMKELIVKAGFQSQGEGEKPITLSA